MSQPQETAAAAPSPEPSGSTTAPHPPASKKRLAAGLAGGAGLALLLAWMAGIISHGEVRPGVVQDTSGPVPPGALTEPARTISVADPREFVGTIRPRSVAQVSAKLLARVLAVEARMGQEVQRGQVLARLDDREVQARAGQARLGLAAARANLGQAQSDLARVQSLAAKGAATPSDLDAASARAAALRADVSRLEQAVAEAALALAEAEVRAPVDGRVLERRVEPGDMAAPGVPLFLLQATQGGLRIEAWVPESCACTVSVGDRVQARLDASGRELTVTLDEIAPSSEAGSHSFLVKAAIPPDVPARPGEFARLIRPCAARPALLVPAAAVRTLGQLELVTVVADGRTRARHVRTGKRFGAQVEVLAGLRAGEQVLLPGSSP